ncbi:MAG: ADP-ribosylation factor-like protein [Promethearchaeota archaeon]
MMKESKKLIFAGLDNSGKTSINLALKDNITNTGLLKPTILVERSTMKYLDYDIIQHDMGGQKKFILSYLKDPSKYFDETNMCVFVIDVQDTGRMNESVNYFKEVLSRFEELEIKPPVYVLFHKAERLLFEANQDDINNMEALEGMIRGVNNNRFNVKFETTTIMDLWSISRTFSKIINEMYPADERMKELMRELAKEKNAIVTMVIDDHLLPIADNVESPEQEELVKNTAPYLFQIKEKLQSMKSKTSSNLKVLWEDYEINLLDITGGTMKLFLLVIGIQDTLFPLERDFMNGFISKVFSIINP